jgi:hypothetical protein
MRHVRHFVSIPDDELLAQDPRNQHLMGQRKGLSFLDKKLANLMYKCNSEYTGCIKIKGMNGPQRVLKMPETLRS